MAIELYDTYEEDIYLTIQLLNSIRVVAFVNKNRKTDKHPHFKGDGVAIWINYKQKEHKQNEKIKKDFDYLYSIATKGH